jgi:N-hydroxyarylamine O-acetyltransferase
LLNNHHIEKYLEYLDVNISTNDLTSLNRLVKSQLIKFPFENISKLILQEEKQLNGLVDADTHLNNSIEFGLGGTCYPNNYYFNELLRKIGFNVTLHGSRMGTQKDVHLVSIAKFNSDLYHIDVGYGAPFYDALPLIKFPSEIKWGSLLYKLNLQVNKEVEVIIEKNNQKIHSYVVNNTPREIRYFADIIEDSFAPYSEFMKCLRIFRFFDDYGVELKNSRYIVHRNNNSTEYIVKNLDELKEVTTSVFQLPNIPVERAVEILNKRKNINIFEE